MSTSLENAEMVALIIHTPTSQTMEWGNPKEEKKIKCNLFLIHFARAHRRRNIKKSCQPAITRKKKRGFF